MRDAAHGSQQQRSNTNTRISPWCAFQNTQVFPASRNLCTENTPLQHTGDGNTDLLTNTGSSSSTLRTSLDKCSALTNSQQSWPLKDFRETHSGSLSCAGLVPTSTSCCLCGSSSPKKPTWIPASCPWHTTSGFFLVWKSGTQLQLCLWIHPSKVN